MKLAVISDFDGTATYGIVARLVLNELSSDLDLVSGLRRSFLDGQISFSKYQEEAFRTIPADEDLVKKTAVKVAKLREGFIELIKAIEKRGNSKLIVTSSGLDIYIKPVLENAGFKNIKVEAVTASCEGEWRFSYPNWNKTCPCLGKWATCKCLSVKRQKLLGYKTVFVGDELFADLCATKSADYVFASKKLFRCIEDKGIKANLWEDNLFSLVNFVENI